MCHAVSSASNTVVSVSGLLAQIEQSCEGVMILSEGLERDELLRSRLTRAEVVRQVRQAADSAARLSQQTRKDLAEPDWSGWALTARRLDETAALADDALWFAVTALAPATLMWLRVYRQSQPRLFLCDPGGAG